MGDKEPYLQAYKRTYRLAVMSLLKDRIKQARKHAGLTQRELADAVGVSQPVISQLEKGDNLQSVHLLKIAVACSVNAAWLADGEGEMASNKLGESAGHYGANSVARRSTMDLIEGMLATKAGKALSPEARNLLMSAAQDAPEDQPSRSNVVTGDFTRNGRVADGDILIPQYDIRASMGHGQVPAEYAEFIRNVAVNAAEMEKLGLSYTSQTSLSIITGWGQSMEPTINDKDPLIIDRGVDEFAGDGVYVLTWDGDLYIKRLQKADVPDHLDMISDNKNHKDRVVPVDDVRIHAKVLYIWNGKKA